ncbi:MAG: response regulator transcription factor [Deltaproteobacteria bacterium]|jgi:DNA-binding NarL/FixJ family response regulator|nr:response regulator transcription factor [Deltaproteobacteria bacterium]MCW8892442.1 response regulator transcription factor [Deltaproteobacteria bacterium]MCW9050071.1 response regulator transcription factor [Deltaproteobacteria bacterium]
MIKILLVDDHLIFRQGIQSLFDQTDDFQVVAVAGNGLSAIELAKLHLPDIVIMDVTMPDLNGIDATRRILNELPQVKVIGLSMHSDQHFVKEMFKAGASGYLLKDEAFDELLSAIEGVMRGETYLPSQLSTLLIQDLRGKDGRQDLTQRELEVLQLLASGKNTKQTAETLFVSVKTVETHRSNIFSKLKLRNLADLTRYAIRNGLITP